MKFTKSIFALILGLLIWGCGGVQEKKSVTTFEEQSSYAIGNRIGTDMKGQKIDLDLVAFYTGLKHGFEGSEALITPAVADSILRKLQQMSMEKMQAERTAAGGKNKEAGEKFLAENATKEGITVLKSGIQYKVLESGNGNIPKASDKVRVDYTGRLVDGTVFDSSVERGQPAEFPVTGVIKGWQEVLQLMKEGDKWEVYIPSDLAYGERGEPRANIGPSSTLVFEISLISIL